MFCWRSITHFIPIPCIWRHTLIECNTSLSNRLACTACTTYERKCSRVFRFIKINKFIKDRFSSVHKCRKIFMLFLYACIIVVVWQTINDTRVLCNTAHYLEGSVQGIRSCLCLLQPHFQRI